MVRKSRYPHFKVARYGYAHRVSSHHVRLQKIPEDPLNSFLTTMPHFLTTLFLRFNADQDKCKRRMDRDSYPCDVFTISHGESRIYVLEQYPYITPGKFPASVFLPLWFRFNLLPALSCHLRKSSLFFPDCVG